MNIKVNKKNFIVVSLIFILTLSLIGCSDKTNDASYRPLLITGDMKSAISLDSYDGEQAIDALIEDADGEPKEIYFVAHDGFTSKVDATDASSCTLLCDEENGWYIDAPDFPPSTNAKNLAQIIVISENSNTGILIDNERMSLGKILTSPLTYYPVSEGTSETEGNKSEVFTQEKGFIPEALDGKSFVLYTDAGEKFLINGTGYFIVDADQINFRETNGEYYENIEKVETRK